MIRRACVCLLVIVAGLALRGFGRDLGLPASVIKYGGSVLWGTMVLFLVAILMSGHQRMSAVGFAMAVAVGVELSRLIHTPALDAFRLTTAGALLLGRIFSPWDIVAYAVGIGFGAALDRWLGSIGRLQRIG